MGDNHRRRRRRSRGHRHFRRAYFNYDKIAAVIQEE